MQRLNMSGKNLSKAEMTWMNKFRNCHFVYEYDKNYCTEPSRYMCSCDMSSCPDFEFEEEPNDMIGAAEVWRTRTTTVSIEGKMETTYHDTYTENTDPEIDCVSDVINKLFKSFSFCKIMRIQVDFGVEENKIRI